MCDDFFCRGCQNHKKVSVRSTHKVGGAFCCNGCAEKMAKLRQPKIAVTRDGEVFSIAAEHLRTSKIHTNNKRTASTVDWLIAYGPSR